MEAKLKLILNKLIYNILDLEKIESDIINAGIKNKEIINKENYDIVSKYFFLKNDIYLERLSIEELNFLERELNNINFSNIVISEELTKFLYERLNKISLPDTAEKYLSYCGTGDNYLAPSDAIVLGFHYLKYFDSNEEEVEQQEVVLYDKLNYIQNVLAPSKNMKVAVLIFDDLVNEKSNSYYF